MGFSKRILSGIDAEKETYQKDPESYIRNVMKVESLSGPSESVNWVNKKLKEYYERESIKKGKLSKILISTLFFK